jgi:hypothetical protein
MGDFGIVEELDDYYYDQPCNIDTNIEDIISFNFLRSNHYYRLDEITYMKINGNVNNNVWTNIPIQLARVLTKFTNLTELDLSKCDFVSYELLLFLPTIEVLTIKNNNLPPLNISNPKLKKLYFEMFSYNKTVINYLEDFPSTLEELTINCFGEMNQYVKNLNKLQKLTITYKADMGGVRESKSIIGDGEFENLKSLEELTFKLNIPDNIIPIVNSIPNLHLLTFKMTINFYIF